MNSKFYRLRHFGKNSSTIYKFQHLKFHHCFSSYCPSITSVGLNLFQLQSLVRVFAIFVSPEKWTLLDGVKITAGIYWPSSLLKQWHYQYFLHIHVDSIALMYASTSDSMNIWVWWWVLQKLYVECWYCILYIFHGHQFISYNAFVLFLYAK